MPQKIIKTIETTWEHHQFELYRQVQNEMKAIVVKEGLLKEDNAEAALKGLLRLVQITSNPRLIDESYQSIPGKFDYLKDILLNIVQKGEKCIIWSSFTDNVDWLCDKLSEFGCCKIHGGRSALKEEIEQLTYLWILQIIASDRDPSVG